MKRVCDSHNEVKPAKDRNHVIKTIKGIMVFMSIFPQASETFDSKLITNPWNKSFCGCLLLFILRIQAKLSEDLSHHLQGPIITCFLKFTCPENILLGSIFRIGGKLFDSRWWIVFQAMSVGIIFKVWAVENNSEKSVLMLCFNLIVNFIRAIQDISQIKRFG